MEEGRLTKKVTKWSQPGRRKQGRPKATWAEGIRGLMGEKGINGRRLEGQRQMEEKDNCQMGAGRCGNVEQPAK